MTGIMMPPTCSSSSPADPRRQALIGLALVLAVFLVYGQTGGHELIGFDDGNYFCPRVKAGLTRESIAWAFTTDHGSNWHPLTWLSLMLDCELFGDRLAGGTHLENAGLHAANVVMLFLVLAGMTGATGRSACVAALFALHPIHVESVAWATERKDTLSTFFGLLAIAAYARYARAPSWRRFLPVCLAHALSLLAKPMLVTLPCALLLLDYWPLSRLEENWPSFGRRLLEKLPLFLLSAASVVMTLRFEHGSIGVPLVVLPFAWRVVNLCLAYLLYLRNLVWPFQLALLYPHPLREANVPLAGLAALLLLALTWCLFRFRRRQPALLVGWLWYLGMLVPVIGLMQVGAQAMADRYAYVPFWGIYIMIVWGAAAWLRPRAARLLAAFVIVALALLAWRQAAFWQNSRCIFTETVRHTEGNWIMLGNLALALIDDRARDSTALDEAERYLLAATRFSPKAAVTVNRLGVLYTCRRQPEEALARFEQAVTLDPQYADARNNLGRLLIARGRFSEARAQLVEAIRLDDNSLAPRLNLARLALSQDAPDEAAAQLESVLRLDPANAEALGLLGYARLRAGEREEAERLLRRALEIAPHDADARYNLGRLEAEQGRTAAAIREYRQALADDPDCVEAMNGLAWILATSADPAMRDAAAARGGAERAVELTGRKDPGCLDTLAAALAAGGDFARAAAVAGEAEAAAAQAGDRRLANEIAARRRGYAARRPYLETHGDTGVR